MNGFFQSTKTSKKEYIIIIFGVLCSLAIGMLGIITKTIAVFFAPIIILGAFIFIVLLFKEPLVGLFSSLAYAFLMGVFDREIGGFSYGTGNELLLLLTWLSIWYNARKYDFKILKSDLIILFLIWFGINVLELINPAGASPRGWLQEIRSTALYPLLITPLGLLLLNSRKKLNFFIVFILLLSLLAVMNGIKQIKISPWPGEQAFLDNGGDVTHIIGGQLRVFSFYSDAGQFGASQAQFAVIALILAMGLKNWWKKIFLLLLAGLFFYGMLISGTRGAFFALIAGICCAILVSKNFKAVFIGGALALLFVVFLKFTYIGNSNYNIYRLRTALDPNDASLNVRLMNQLKLKDYLSAKPFGGGLGSIGHWGMEYNPGSYLATIPPDSYWVKVWAMYGIVGLIIFFSIWMFLIGRCAGMIWNIKDRNLKTKLIALLAGIVGIFLCSYGNEVMNAMPSLIVIHLSLGVIYAMCRIHKQEQYKEI